MSTNEWAGAKCVQRQDLPWTDDARPSAQDIRSMQSICAECPALIKCATHALGPVADGGFYAGIWLPWSQTLSEPLLATRRTARTQLRHIARRFVRA